MRYRIDFACDDQEESQKLLNELYQYGDDLGTKVLHRCRLNLFSQILDALIRNRRISAFGSALDIGCNAGMYSAILSDAGFRRVVGVDVEPDMIERARRHFARSDADRVVEFRVERAEDLQGSGLYDFVLCTEVVEHTEDPERTIANIRSMIAPGGVAVISMPNCVSIPYVKAWLAYQLRRQPRNQDFENHLKYPFFRTMSLFIGGGLRRIETHGTNLIWDDRLLYALYPRSFFPSLNRFLFVWGRAWPFKFFCQFFYVVVRRES